MSVLFALLFLLSSLGLTLGFVNPRLVLPWSETKTRKSVAITYGIPTLAFMALTGVTAPPESQPQVTAPASQSSETPTSTPPLEPVPSVSVTPAAVKPTPLPDKKETSSADSVTPAKPSVSSTPASDSSGNTNAVIVGEDASSAKNIRTGPGMEHRVQHIAYSSDRVETLDSAQDSGGYTWYKVRFPKSGAEGWIAAQLIEQDGSSVASESDKSSAPTSEAAPGSSVTQNASGSGRCDHPDDLDARGRRCGKRAASERPGGQ